MKRGFLPVFTGLPPTETLKCNPPSLCVSLPPGPAGRILQGLPKSPLPFRSAKSEIRSSVPDEGGEREREHPLPSILPRSQHLHVVCTSSLSMQCPWHQTRTRRQTEQEGMASVLKKAQQEQPELNRPPDSWRRTQTDGGLSGMV